jgi:hypothetical protein
MLLTLFTTASAASSTESPAAAVAAVPTAGVTHADRRLHQLKVTGRETAQRPR